MVSSAPRPPRTLPGAPSSPLWRTWPGASSLPRPRPRSPELADDDVLLDNEPDEELEAVPEDESEDAPPSSPPRPRPWPRPWPLPSELERPALLPDDDAPEPEEPDDDALEPPPLRPLPESPPLASTALDDKARAMAATSAVRVDLLKWFMDVLLKGWWMCV